MKGKSLEQLKKKKEDSHTLAKGGSLDKLKRNSPDTNKSKEKEKEKETTEDIAEEVEENTSEKGTGLRRSWGTSYIAPRTEEERVWEMLVNLEQDNQYVVIPCDIQDVQNVEQFLSIKLEPKQVSALARMARRHSGACISVRHKTMEEMLYDFPELVGYWQDADGKKEITTTLKLSEKSQEAFDAILQSTTQYKNIKDIIIKSLQLEDERKSVVFQGKLHLIYKLLKHYTPTNASYVTGVIGDIKHKTIILNTIYFFASLTRFALKQYHRYTTENTLRAVNYYQSAKALLKQMYDEDLINLGRREVWFVVLKAWDEVNKERAISSIHTLKVAKYTLGMFIALSGFMLQHKQQTPTFKFDPAFTQRVSKEFSELIRHNLDSHNFNTRFMDYIRITGGGVSYSAISPQTFLYKLEYLHLHHLTERLLEDKQSSSIEEEDYTQNDILISNFIQQIVTQLTEEKAFVMNKAFIDIEGSSAEDKSLQTIMMKISNAIGSQAGIKHSTLELKIWLLFKAIAATATGYALHRFLTCVKWSASAKLFLDFTGNKVARFAIKSLISYYTKRFMNEYNRYNKLDEEFNRNIEALFHCNSIYPRLLDSGEISEIELDPKLKLMLQIIALSFKKDSVEETETFLSSMHSQDLSAASKTIFNLLAQYVIEHSDGKIQLEQFADNHIKELSEMIAGHVDYVRSIKSGDKKSSINVNTLRNNLSKDITDYLNSNELIRPGEVEVEVEQEEQEEEEDKKRANSPTNNSSTSRSRVQFAETNSTVLDLNIASMLARSTSIEDRRARLKMTRSQSVAVGSSGYSPTSSERGN